MDPARDGGDQSDDRALGRLAFSAIGRDKPSESRRSVSQLTPAEERLEALYGRRSPKELNLGKDAQTQLVTV